MTAADLEAFAKAHLLPLALELLVALVIFLVGRQLAKVGVGAFDRMLERARIDMSLRKFLTDVVYAVLLVTVIMAALDAIGVETTAVLAVLGAAGLAIGLALQGSLANVAAGVMLIALRPYKVGDVVTIGKYAGRVTAIRVFQTILVTPDHREVLIPNAQIVAHPIENLSALGHRRLDLLVSVANTTDVARVRALLEQVVIADARLQDSPAPEIDLAELGDDGMKVHVRPWTAVENYAKVASDTMERIKETMEAAGLSYRVTMQVAP